MTAMAARCPGLAGPREHPHVPADREWEVLRRLPDGVLEPVRPAVRVLAAEPDPGAARPSYTTVAFIP